MRHWNCGDIRNNYFYHPQHSCGKCNVFTPVCQSFCSQGSVSQHALGQTPPSRQTCPSMHWGRHPLQADMSRHALGKTPLPPGRHIPACTGADTPIPWADISQHALGQTPPRRPLQRTARILLECILVLRII